jgi:hypothetical protein
VTAADRDSILWDIYRSRFNEMLEQRSPETEGAAVQAYSTWCRSFIPPGEADRCITIFCARYLPTRRRAA